MMGTNELEQLLTDSADRHGIVGASLAVARGDELVENAHGVINANTGVDVTTDTVFQIGSITKLFTATLMMQLVDDGLVDLDTPLSRALPELDLADSTATTTTTIAHLLTHTSGIEGDHFMDTGPGDDCVERFVVSCSALPQLYAPGAHFSYCNTGFVLAGRIIERLRGAPWHTVLEQWILDPLELRSMGTEPGPATSYPSPRPIWRAVSQPPAISFCPMHQPL